MEEGIFVEDMGLILECLLRILNSLGEGERPCALCSYF